MSSLETQISYYLRIAIDINKKIGGKRGYEAQASGKDKFSILKDNIAKDIHYVKAKLNERDRKTGAEVLGINMEIKQKMLDINNQIDRIKQSVNADSSKNSNAQEIKFQIIERLSDQVKNLQQIIEGVSDDLKNLTGNRTIETETDKRAMLLGKDAKNNKNIYRVKKANEPTQIEMEAMQRWKKNDELIDAKLDDLTDKTIEWKKKVKMTGELIDESDKKIDQLTEQVDKVNDDLLKSNKQLKGIVEKYRKPHKFCLDVVLVLILIGLIVGIIKLST